MNDRPLRVLVLTNIYPTPESPAAAPSVKYQIEALKSLGVDITLWYIRQGHSASYLAMALKVFLLNFQRKKYDLIHAFFGHSGLLACLQFRYPVVVTFLGSDLLGGLGGLDKPNAKDGWIGRFAARFVDAVITMSEEMKRVSKRDDAVVIPFGIDTNIFTPIPTLEARQQLGLPLERKIALFPWNPARAEKRFSFARDAVNLLNAQGKNVELIAIYNKQREDVIRFMSASDVMILSSAHEGAPVAVREALACNLPIISVDVGDVKDLIDGVNHCYICERTPQDMADKIQKVLDANHRSNGRIKMQALSIYHSAERVKQVYQFAITHRKRISAAV